MKTIYTPENPLAMELNLDAMPLSELEKFAQECGACGCSAQMAKKLFPAKQRGYRKAANLLSNYAWNKLTAMKLRLDGEINRAIEYESICDRIYDRMPDWAKGW